MYIFICEDSLDGILTGVYNAWSFKIERKTIRHEDICLSSSEPENYQLFCEYHPVSCCSQKAEKVRHTLCQKLGLEFYEAIVNAALSREPSGQKEMDKADAIYKTIVLALHSPAGAGVLNYLGEPYIHRVFTLSRATHNESHHLIGFLRFCELENGVLFSKIHPKNNVLPYLAEHFTDRFPQENFIIYDEDRKLAVVHRAGKNYMFVDASELNEDLLQRHSEKEVEFQKLWLTFFDSIAIEARINPSLQSQNIPKRFWKDTVELKSLLEHPKGVNSNQ